MGDQDTGERRHGPQKGAARRGWGRIRKERNGRYSAAYVGPDGVLYRAPSTFDALAYAEGWLGEERRLIDLRAWQPPVQREEARRQAIEDRRAEAVTFREYAEAWLVTRRDADHDALRPTTARDYRLLLDNHLLPVLGRVALVNVTPDVVEAWHRGMALKKTPRARAKAYMLLSTIMNAAVVDKGTPVAENPCRIKGAGRAKPRSEVEPANVAELAAIVQAMPERLRLSVQLAAWCALRYGEVFELRRGDVRLEPAKGKPTAGVVRIRRGVTWADGQVFNDQPKTDAGVREVAIPPHLLGEVRAHLADHTEPGANSLLFPAARGGNMRPSSFEVYWHKARKAAKREDLTFHGLRHTGAVLAAQAGATISELQERLGHATPAMAMHYQHAARGRDQLIAQAMSKMIEAEATPAKRPRRRPARRRA